MYPNPDAAADTTVDTTADIAGGRDAAALFEVSLPVRSIDDLIPSPDGAYFALRSSPQSVQVYTRDAKKRLWSYSVTESPTVIAWSADGQKLALGTQSAGLVLDTRTGTPVHRACGPWFEARVGAPFLHPRLGTASVCSQ